MKIKNSELIDPERGIFSVLGLVALRLSGPYLWNSCDIDDEMVQGAIFQAYEPEDSEDEMLDVASIMVVDATNDSTELDISVVKQDNISSVDEFLREGIQAQLKTEGAEIIQWMSSQLNQSETLKGLLTAYIIKEQGRNLQVIALRVKIKGRKIVIIGNFDIAKKELLAAPIFNIIRNIVVLDD